MSDEDIKCPFCKETGFDLVGLKDHLFGRCEAYEKTESVAEERERLIKERHPAYISKGESK